MPIEKRSGRNASQRIQKDNDFKIDGETGYMQGIQCPKCQFKFKMWLPSRITKIRRKARKLKGFLRF